MKPSVDYIIQPLNVSHPSCEGLLIGINKDIQVPFPFFKIKKIGKCIFALQIPEEETGSFPYYFIWKKYNMKPLLLKYLSVCACMLSHFSCV